MELPKSISSNQEQHNEVSLKELILTIREWSRYILGKWLIIIMLGLVGSLIGLSYAFIKKPLYVAELTFVLEDSKSSSLGVYAGLANQFGIDLGGASASGVFSGDNILEFLKSRLMVENTLLSTLMLDGKVQSLADRYIEMNNMRKGWEDDPALKNLHFPVTLKRKDFSRQQDSVLNVIYEEIIKDNLQVNKPDKKLSFISAVCSTKDEIFSKAFTERLVREATDFYVQTKTKQSRATIDKLQEKADSIEFLLNRKTYSMAATQDMNLNPARNLAQVNTELVGRDKLVLQTIYAEVVKNLELSRMAMAQETPIIQIVDTPILPLKKEKLGKLTSMIVGGFILSFFTVLYLIVKRLYNNIMY